MASRDEVIYAYRFLLGRDPENEEVVAHYANEVAGWRKLREFFMASPEFHARMADAGAPRPAKTPLAGPPMRVQLDAPEDQLAVLFARTRAQWQHLGATEPHWSVLTHENYTQQNIGQNRTAFYASGEAELKGFEAALARAGLSLDRAQTCLELGCGIGRTTAALAKRYQQVIGVDISPAHMRLAHAWFEEQGIDNVTLRHLDAVEDARHFGPFDVLYSRLVLQHNSPPVTVRLLQDLLGTLNPGGIAFFQLPTYQAGYRFDIEGYLAQANSTQMELHFLPQPVLLRLITTLGCRVLEIREDDSIGLSATAISNVVLVQKAGATA